MCPLNVAAWSDKQLDELTDLLRSADFSGVASFISQNFIIGNGSRIMDDSSHTPLRVTVGTNTTTVRLSAGLGGTGVFQHNGKIGHVNTDQVINILNPTGPGNWGPGLTAVGMGAARWSIISIKQSEQFNTTEQRWFVDDTVQPNLYSQRATLTLINKAYFDIIVTHGTPGGSIPSTPPGYFTICEIYIPDGTVTLGVAGSKGGGGVVITDTQDGISGAATKNWYTSADATLANPQTRVLRLEFLTGSLFDVDHQTADGFHKPGAWHIGSTTVTSLAAELNKLSGTSANVNPANLNTLTAGSGSNASLLHSHALVGLTANPGYVILQNGLIIQWGQGTTPPAPPTPPQISVSFPIVFPNAALGIAMAGRTTGPAMISYSNLTTSGMTMYTSGGGGEELHYIVIGF